MDAPAPDLVQMKVTVPRALREHVRKFALLHNQYASQVAGEAIARHTGWTGPLPGAEELEQSGSETAVWVERDRTCANTRCKKPFTGTFSSRSGRWRSTLCPDCTQGASSA